VAANSAMRQWSCYRARAAQGMVYRRWERAHITVQARYADGRRRDNDSLLASLKSAIDGLVDAELLRDDDKVMYTVLPAVIDRANPGVTMTIREGDE
jgi:Holliday junction resolvase RusA-like endonuclease